ncbi:BQ5605_C003g01905 [Microbotryum silenes-dioicae]|uniref:BQ5605_C003g01905 protein n=1 Tax=Microbotryum silenes-dioicae TaxID=796604 RepID=A0A2X0M082_9BASI|nr:BQ5605_C003g01905 [Microbotryum silenes-dioicae]
MREDDGVRVGRLLLLPPIVRELDVFTGIQLLLDILRRICGFDSRFLGLKVAIEEAQLGELWGPSKAMSHESIISDIEQLLPLLRSDLLALGLNIVAC